MISLPEDNLSREIIGAAIEVHKVLGGPGLLEGVYEEAFVEELMLRHVQSERQVPVPIYYKSKSLGKQLYIDLLVADRVLVEVKATEEHNPLFEAQLLTYLRLTNKRLGLLINFGLPLLKDSIHRVVNNLH